MKNLLVLLSLVVLFVSLPSVVFASLPPGFDGFEYVEQPEASQTAGTAEEEVVPPLEIKVNFVDEVEEAAQAELDARRDAENISVRLLGLRLAFSAVGLVLYRPISCLT